MFPHVVANYVRQASYTVGIGGPLHYCLADIAVRQIGRERSPAPGPAEIQTIQMRDLAVAAISNSGGDEERSWSSLGNSRKKSFKPIRELLSWTTPLQRPAEDRQRAHLLSQKHSQTRARARKPC